MKILQLSLVMKHPCFSFPSPRRAKMLLLHLGPPTAAKSFYSESISSNLGLPSVSFSGNSVVILQLEQQSLMNCLFFLKKLSNIHKNEGKKNQPVDFLISIQASQMSRAIFTMLSNIIRMVGVWGEHKLLFLPFLAINWVTLIKSCW